MSDIVDRDQSIPLRRQFQNHEIVALPFEGELFVILVQLESAWGYAPKGLAKQLARWQTRGQVREGTHYRKLTNGTLAAFKAAAGDWFAKCEPVHARAPSLLVITERGLYRLLTLIPDKAIAIAFQDWLEVEVLPAINRTGRYDSALPERPISATPPPEPPAPRPAIRRGPRPRRLSGPAGELADLLDRYQRAGIIDPSAHTALRAQAERLAALLPVQDAAQRTRALPAPAARRLLPGPVIDLEAQLDQAMGPRPEDHSASIHYDVGRDSLRKAVVAREEAARGESTPQTNDTRLSGVEVWIRWIHLHRMSPQAFGEALTRLEDVTDKLFGPMPGRRS